MSLALDTKSTKRWMTPNLNTGTSHLPTGAAGGFDPSATEKHTNQAVEPITRPKGEY